MEQLSQDGRDLLRTLLDAISASIPLEAIYSDYSTNPREVKRKSISETEAVEKLNDLRQFMFGEGPGDSKAFLQLVQSTHLFDEKMNIVEKFVNRVFK